jgi:chromosome condensin MukBEF MukE localization factor
VKRLFWLALGITLGVLTMRKVSRAAQKLTPQGMSSALGQGLSDLAAAIGEFGADVRAAMTEREAQLRESTGLDGRLGHRPQAAEPPQAGRAS